MSLIVSAAFRSSARKTGNRFPLENHAITAISRAGRDAIQSHIACAAGVGRAGMPVRPRIASFRTISLEKKKIFEGGMSEIRVESGCTIKYNCDTFDPKKGLARGHE
ncbi:MAG: hypothetical protein WDN24_01855 [Sphingomonas sp.]